MHHRYTVVFRVLNRQGDASDGQYGSGQLVEVQFEKTAHHDGTVVVEVKKLATVKAIAENVQKLRVLFTSFEHHRIVERWIGPQVAHAGGPNAWVHGGARSILAGDANLQRHRKHWSVVTWDGYLLLDA